MPSDVTPAGAFEAEWQKFLDCGILGGASLELMSAMRPVFYAGGHAYMKAMREAMEDHDDEDSAFAAIDALQSHVEGWMATYVAAGATVVV